MNISNTRIVFCDRYTKISFYNISNQTFDAGFTIYSGNPAAPFFVAIQVSATGVITAASTGAPAGTTPNTKYQSGTARHPISDVWNTDNHIIVGTGDLRPGMMQVITPLHELTGTGVILSCPNPNELIVYKP